VFAVLAVVCAFEPDNAAFDIFVAASPPDILILPVTDNEFPSQVNLSFKENLPELSK
jgi:hypothetical protein